MLRTPAGFGGGCHELALRLGRLVRGVCSDARATVATAWWIGRQKLRGPDGGNHVEWRAGRALGIARERNMDYFSKKKAMTGEIVYAG
jgi:hypothetical protein